MVHDEASAELYNALSHGFHSLFEGHVLLEVLVENGVHEVGGVSVGSLAHTLEATKVVQVVHLGFFFDVVIATEEDVDLVRSTSKSFGHLGAHVLSSLFYSRLETSLHFHEVQVAHDVVSELVALGLLTGSSTDLRLVHLHDFIFVTLESKDGPVDVGISNDNAPVLSTNSKNRVHFELTKI